MPPLAYISSVIATMSSARLQRQLEVEAVAQVAQHAVQHDGEEQVAGAT